VYPNAQTAAYDRVATMFSPDGRLYQVEYASKIVDQGTLGVGICYNEGVIFGADKKVPSKLILPESIEKLFQIDNHIAAVSAGLVGDARRLVSLARQKAQENVMYYEEDIMVETLVKEVSNFMQLVTQYGGMRPFGVSLIIGGVDPSGGRLFETEPSGALAEYKALAIGKGKQKAMTLMEKNYRDNLPLKEGVSLLVKALEAGQGEKEKLDLRRIDVAFIDKEGKYNKIPNEKISSYLAR